MASTCANCGFPLAPGARFCANCGTPVVPTGLEEERKVVTILFADVTESTTLGEQLDPERLRALLGVYFNEMTSVISSWGGAVEKYVGDAIMAVFGVPTIREDDADRALHAALEMQERLAGLNERFERDHGVNLQVRTGVNTGDVVAPSGPVPEQRIVAGDAVNVAARLEQAAEPGTILVGERTYASSRFAFRFAPPVSLELKGKSMPIRARQLLAALPEPQRGIEGLRAPMIGRDRELAVLLDALEEAVESGRPRLVVVYGPAGIGKSRLVNEFTTAVEGRQQEVSFLRGRCLATGQGVTFWALSEILRGAIGVGLADPVDEVRARLSREVGSLLRPLGLTEAETAQTIAALATTAGITLEDGERAPVTAEDLARAWPRFATAYSASGAAVWVVEDLHWAGDAVLEMLERIVTRTDGPLVVVATARPELAELHPSFAGWAGLATSVSLRPLTDAQSGELLTSLLEVADLPEALRSEILDRAEGNPFFVEEIIQRLIDEGAIVNDAGHWRATGAATAPIPDSVQALVAARVDALAPLERRALQEGAVVGRTFWAAPLERAIGRDGLDEALGGLERKGLIVVRPTSSLAGETEYQFKHAVVREVAYASVPKARRARAHAELGSWIASVNVDRQEEVAELIAHHYLTAVAGEDADLGWLSDPQGREEVRRKAHAALLVAGRVARHRFATDAAVSFHIEALSISGTDAERLDAYDELGRDHDSAFHGDDAFAAYLSALALARNVPGAEARITSTARRIGELVSTRGGAFRGFPDLSSVDALLEEALALVNDPRERARLLIAYGAMALRWMAQSATDPRPMERRIDSVREAGSIAHGLDDAELQFKVADSLNDLYTANGEYQRALAEIERGLGLLDRLTNPSAQAGAYFEAAMGILQLDGDARRSRAYGERSRALAKDRSAHEQMHATSVLIEAAYRLGEWDDAIRYLDEHLASFAAESEARCVNVQSGPSLGALVVAHRGDRQRALELAALGRPFEQVLGPVEGAKAGALVAAGHLGEGLALANRVLREAPRFRTVHAAEAAIHAYELTGDAEAMREVTGRVEQLGQGYAFLRPIVERGAGLAAVADGDREAGLARMRGALERLEELGDRFEAARTRELLADLVSAAEARPLLDEALATYRQLGATPHISRLEERIAHL